jgi:hypothetical protein
MGGEIVSRVHKLRGGAQRGNYLKIVKGSTAAVRARGGRNAMSRGFHFEEISEVDGQIPYSRLLQDAVSVSLVCHVINLMIIQCCRRHNIILTRIQFVKRLLSRRVTLFTVVLRALHLRSGPHPLEPKTAQTAYRPVSCSNSNKYERLDGRITGWHLQSVKLRNCEGHCRKLL